jgi:integrase
MPEFESRTFVSVRRGDIVKLLDKIEDERGPGAADMCLAFIRQLASWHQARDENYHSPIARGMRRTKPAERRRKRILSDLEIRTMWRACDKLSVFGALTKMLLLTAQRRTKVATMRWSDIENAVWTIQTASREKGTGQKLKLPRLALDILDVQPRIVNNEFVFPASREGRRSGPGENFGSYSAFAQGKEALDDLMAKTLPDIPHWQLHDLRRTARSLMSRAGVRSEIAERVLGHAIVGVEGVYDVHDYYEQRGQALKKLASLIDRIVHPPASNVVAIRQRELA